MDPKSIVILAFQLSIVCTVLGFGLHGSRNDLLYPVSYTHLTLPTN